MWGGGMFDVNKPYTLSYLDKGKRSQIYLLEQGGRKFALKVERDDIDAVDRVFNESVFLTLLNESGIGPRLVEGGCGYMFYEYVPGKFICDYLAGCKNPWPVLRRVFLQCRQMDVLGINKLEMHKPVKHILVFRGKPVLLDFERCYYAKRPKNVSQFAQFLLSERVRPLVRGKLRYRADAVRLACQRYQRDQSDVHFEMVLGCFTKP